MGVSGFLISWASRRATSRHAATFCARMSGVTSSNTSTTPSAAPPQTLALVDECTSTIVGEVESLKGLVDEFSQFARMPSPRTVPTDLAQLITDTVALYNGIFTDVRIDQRFAPGVPLVRLDPEQIRRVIINLMDNSIEAMASPQYGMPMIGQLPAF